jgi:HEPN domain-containing protein
MKQTTEEWLLLAAKNLSAQNRLSNLTAFHCQQCIEKCFKEVMEEKEISFLKSYDLLRLQQLTNMELNDADTHILRILNEVYLDSRYPGDLGLLPHGKPLPEEIESFIRLTEKIFTLVTADFN